MVAHAYHCCCCHHSNNNQKGRLLQYCPWTWGMSSKDPLGSCCLGQVNHLFSFLFFSLTKLTETHRDTEKTTRMAPTHSSTWTDQGSPVTHTDPRYCVQPLRCVQNRRLFIQTYPQTWQTRWLLNLFPFGVEVPDSSEALGSWPQGVLGSWNSVRLCTP